MSSPKNKQPAAKLPSIPQLNEGEANAVLLYLDQITVTGREEAVRFVQLVAKVEGILIAHQQRRQALAAAERAAVPAEGPGNDGAGQ